MLSGVLCVPTIRGTLEDDLSIRGNTEESITVMHAPFGYGAGMRRSPVGRNSGLFLLAAYPAAGRAEGRVRSQESDGT